MLVALGLMMLGAAGCIQSTPAEQLQGQAKSCLTQADCGEDGVSCAFDDAGQGWCMAASDADEDSDPEIIPECGTADRPCPQGCLTRMDCADGERCLTDPATENLVCTLLPGRCWGDWDCVAGTCVFPAADPNLCRDGDNHFDAAGNATVCVIAVAGTCEPGPDEVCYSDRDCDEDSRCAFWPTVDICCTIDQGCDPSVSLCLGSCVPTQEPGCVVVKPGSHGACEMLLGVIFDGTSCVYESGCGCGDDCAAIFQDFDACKAACMPDTAD